MLKLLDKNRERLKEARESLLKSKESTRKHFQNMVNALEHIVIEMEKKYER